MPSPFPCYPQPYPWGGAAVPPLATGLYRALFQACDALGYARMYPSAGMQCAGRIIRGDQWCADDLRLMMQWISGGTYPLYWDRWLFPAGSDFVTSVAQAGGNCPGGVCFTKWGWWPLRIPGREDRFTWVVVGFNLPGVPTMRMDTGDVHPYNAAPWSNYFACPDALVIAPQAGHALDGAWFNAI